MAVIPRWIPPFFSVIAIRTNMTQDWNLLYIVMSKAANPFLFLPLCFVIFLGLVQSPFSLLSLLSLLKISSALLFYKHSFSYYTTNRRDRRRASKTSVTCLLSIKWRIDTDTESPWCECDVEGISCLGSNQSSSLDALHAWANLCMGKPLWSNLNSNRNLQDKWN